MKQDKQTLREEAKRKRALLSLSAADHDALCENFLNAITPHEQNIVALYWSKGRELDTQILIDTLLERNITIALPVIQKGNRVLKFVRFNRSSDMVVGPFDILQPNSEDYIEPDIVTVPLLAFDQRGNRLGYGGGYYDATLAALKEKQDVTTVGLAYAQQACLFALPAEDHDVKLDWVITEQSAQKF